MTTTQPHFVSIMKTLASRCFGRPWQALLLLLIGMPVVWAAGVSISNLTINTFKQVSFAEAEVGVDVGAKVTRTATIKYSTGTVSYSSGNAAVATVNAQTGEVTGVQPGETTITATQAAKSPYPQATASYKIKVNGKPVTFADWALPSVVFSEGLTFQLSPTPTSDVPGTPTITYSTLDNDTSVVSITPAGLVTVKGKGTATIVATQAPLGEYNGGTTQATLEVSAATPVFTWPAQTVQLGQTLSLADPTDSPNKGGAFSYVVNPDGSGNTIATIDNNTKVLTPSMAGSTTITVTQAASGNYGPASLPVNLTVQPGTFTITGFTLAERTFDPFVAGNNSFELPVLAKPANSSSSYVFTLKNPQDGVASISGSTVTVLKPGETTIIATLARDSQWHEEAIAEARLVVNKAIPTITLAAVQAYTGGPAIQIPVDSTNSGTPIQLSLVNAQPAGLASLAEASGQWTATIQAAGKADLVATQDPSADGVFAGATATVSFTVTDQASLPANPLSLANFEKPADADAFLPPWANAIGDPATIKVTSSNHAVATVNGQHITLTGQAGDTDITLTQEAQAGHQRAEVTATLTVTAVTKQTTTLSFVPNVIPKTYGDAPFTPTVETPSGLTPVFSILDAESRKFAEIDNNGRVVILGAGTATITATVSSNKYETATATATLEVSKGDPGLSVDMSGPLVHAVADGPFELNLSTQSSGALSVTSSDPASATATIVGTPPGAQLKVRVTPIKATTNLVLTIHQDADDNHNAADRTAVRTLTEQKASITWPLPGEFVLTGPTTVITLPEATSSNTGAGAPPITYSLAPTSIATLSGMDLTLTGTGTVSLTASQAAGNGFAATQFTAPINVVSTASGTLVTTNLIADVVIPVNLGDTFKIPYQTNSDAPVTFRVSEGGANVEVDTSDASGHTFIAKAGGEAMVLIEQAATATHGKASKVVRVTVMDPDPILGWDGITITYDDSKPDVQMTAPLSKSTGAFTYRLDPQGPQLGEIYIDGAGFARLKLLAPGETTLFADQVAKGTFGPDSTSTRLIVHPQPTQLRFNTSKVTLDPLGRAVTRPGTLELVAASHGQHRGAVTYASSNMNVATIDPNTGVVTTVNVGETTLTATQAAWGLYAKGDATLTLIVEDAAPLNMSPFKASLGSTDVRPPYAASDPTREVEISVSDESFATVNSDKVTLTTLKEGNVTVTVRHPATATQASVSASAVMTITPRVPQISGLPESIARTWSGTEQTIVLAPSSENTASTSFTLTSTNEAVASVNGLQVTLRGEGDATLQLTQAASPGWSKATVLIPVKVTPAISGFDNMSLPYGTPAFDLPETLDGQAATYSSSDTTKAEIEGARTLKLTGLGTTTLTATTAAGTKEVTLEVTAGDPLLALADETLPSNSFGITLKASSRSQGAITYTIIEQTPIISGPVAEISADGHLLVMGAGTVTVKASQAAHGNYAAGSTTARVSISDGFPALVLTKGPPGVVRGDEPFEIRYRANFHIGAGGGSVRLTPWQSQAGVFMVTSSAHYPPAKVGEEGRFVFQMDNNFLAHDFMIMLRSLNSQPAFTSEFDFQDHGIVSLAGFRYEPGAPEWTHNLGPAITVRYSERTPLTLPKLYDNDGNVVPDSCYELNWFTSSNSNVLQRKAENGRYVPVAGFYTVGLGEVYLTCAYPGALPLKITVIGGDPAIQGFSDIELSMDALPHTVVKPYSYNTTGEWTYEILPDEPGAPPIAEVVNGQIKPLAVGKATIRATQKASGNYEGGFITARLTVNPPVIRTFANIYATYGDAPFPVPRPDDLAPELEVTYELKDFNNPDGFKQDVAHINNGYIHIEHAGEVTIIAKVNGAEVARGRLIVRKAKAWVVFTIPSQSLFFVNNCGKSNLIWPTANRPDLHNDVGSRLMTNSNGAWRYERAGQAELFGHYQTVLNEPGHRSYFPDWAWTRWMKVRIEESRDFEAVHSEFVPYRVWGNTNVIWSQSEGDWIESCDQ